MQSVKNWLRWLIPVLLVLAVIGCGSYQNSRWQVLSTDGSPDGLAFLSIAFTSNTHGWALTPFQLLESTSGGQTWENLLTVDGVEKAFQAFTFINSELGWIVGSQKKDNKRRAMILKTNDGGKRWQDQSFHLTTQANIRRAPLLQSVSFCDGNVGWAVGSNLILHTTDGGQIWANQGSVNEDESFYGVTCFNPQIAVAVGQDGVILATEDGGKNWRLQESKTKATLLRVRSFGDNFWAVGTNGTLLRSRVGSNKWESQQLTAAEGAGLADIVFVNSEGWIVGTNGTLLHTNDGGQTWQRQKIPTEASLLCVFFLNPNHGWAGGDKHTLVRFSK
jgi:photosystem II stability/assembly factor-like uncharacterized protein